MLRINIKYYRSQGLIHKGVICSRSINKLTRIIDMTNEEECYIQAKYSNYNLTNLEVRNYFSQILILLRMKYTYCRNQ